MRNAAYAVADRVAAAVPDREHDEEAALALGSWISLTGAVAAGLRVDSARSSAARRLRLGEEVEAEGRLVAPPAARCR